MSIHDSFCAARYSMTQGPVPLHGPGVGDRWANTINITSKL